MAEKLRDVITELLECPELNPKKVCRETEKTIAWAKSLIVDKPKSTPKKKAKRGICSVCKLNRVLNDDGRCKKCVNAEVPTTLPV